MITRAEADPLAEEVIADYVAKCGAETPEELRKVGELLISKMAHGIAKYRGFSAVENILSRTRLSVVEDGGYAP